MTMTNNSGDEEQWVAGPDNATRIVWAYGMFFLSQSTSFFCMQLYLYNIFTTQNFSLNPLGPVTDRLGLNWSRPVEELIETGTDRSLMVPVQVFNFLGFGKPVAVAVLPKKGKKSDRTGLLNTSYTWG